VSEGEERGTMGQSGGRRLEGDWENHPAPEGIRRNVKIYGKLDLNEKKLVYLQLK